MARLWTLLRGNEKRYSIDEYMQDVLFAHNGVNYIASAGSSGTSDTEGADLGFAARVASGFKGNPIVFSCELLRLMVFAEARFQWQRLTDGRPGDLFGTTELELLERPWPNGTTGELLMRMLQDADFAGNAFVVRERGANRLRRLRPDWTSVMLSAPPAEAVASDVIGYHYQPGGTASRAKPVHYLPEDVAHWSPIPDPEAQYRGMSWLTPVVREIQADRSATVHKQKFFDNGASPGLAVSFKESVTKEQFDAFMEKLNASHQGVDNAYKTLYLGGGADVTVVGRDLQQLDFKATQGGGETRIAAAAGTPPVLVGLSEGLQGSSLNAGNFSSARRRFADMTVRPLWRSASACLETLFRPPASVRLWYDDRDVPSLREDAKDLAEIEAVRAATIAALVAAGFDADKVVAAVVAEDLTQLKG